MSFFDAYPDFDHRPQAGIQKEFARLAKLMHWDDKKANKLRARCYEEEFTGHMARLNLGSQLEQLQYLCEEVHIEPESSVTKCKKALKQVNVNLVDLMNARRNKVEVRTFSSFGKLMKYTVNSGRFYPKKKAKCDVIKIFLKQFL